MKLSQEDLVLYSLDLVKQDAREDREYSKDSMANAIGISENTLDLYITRLKSDGMVHRIKKKYVHDLRKTVEITEQGTEEVARIEKNIDCLLLTEQRHNIPSCIELTKIMAQLPDPLEKIFFLSLYNHSKYFDLPMLMNSLRLSRDEMNLLNVFCDLDPNPCGIAKESFVESFFSASLYGNVDPEQLRTEIWPKEDINALITLGQAKIRMGRLEDAMMIHDYIMTSRGDLTLNQWFITKINMAQTLERKGDLQGAIKVIDEVLEAVDHRVMQSFARTVKAFYMFNTGDRTGCFETFRSAIGSFTTYGLPLFLSIAHNSRGVCHFIAEDFDEAERDWLKARRYAREAKSEFAEAKILPNLADIAMKGGKHELARSYLERSAEIFQKYNDFEGISVVEFNLALLSLETGDLDGIRDHYRRCKEVAFPLPPPHLLEIFKNDLLKRAKGKGMDGVENII